MNEVQDRSIKAASDEKQSTLPIDSETVSRFATEEYCKKCGSEETHVWRNNLWKCVSCKSGIWVQK